MRFAKAGLLIAERTAICLLGLFLAGGCACSPGSARSAAPVAHYDFGPDKGVAAPSARLRLPVPIKLIAVSAPPPLDSDLFRYRLLYVNPQQIDSYAAARWMMPPSQLLAQRLRDRLINAGAVLATGSRGRALLLHIELAEFAQVFDHPGISRGIVRLRASLLHNGSFVAQRRFAIDVPCASANAAGGARALAAASDAAIDELVEWISVQSLRLL